MTQHQPSIGTDDVSTVAQLNPEEELTPEELLTFDSQRLLFEGSNGHYMHVGAKTEPYSL